MPVPPPVNLDEAVEFLFVSLHRDAIREILLADSNPVMFHHSVGRGIRNDWKIWDQESELVKWFRNNLEVCHADDISSIILEALFAKVRDKQYDPASTVERFHKHWESLGYHWDAETRLETLENGEL